MNALKYIALGATVLYVLLYAALSPGHFQGGDTFEHFQIAKWSLAHPHLLLDHWGKPVFTLLYTLPSQLGYEWAKVFTALIGLCGAWFTFLSAKKLGLKQPVYVACSLLLLPMYFVHLNSVMTEILFATWLIIGVYAMLQKRFWLAALWLSFLPLVRSEGFLLLPFLGLYFLLQKQWKPMLLLATGFLLYSTIGAFVFGDFLWLLHRNPYHVNSTVYGHGSYLHYALSNKAIWGIPLSVLLLVGLLRPMHYQWKSENSIWFWLVVLPFLVVFLFHSYAWGAGKFASYGEIRIMACTAPMAVLLAWSSFDFVHYKLKSGNAVIVVSSLLILMWQLATDTARYTQFLRPRTEEQQAVHDMCERLEATFPHQKVWFVDPQVGVELQRDPFAGAMAKRYFPAMQDYAVSFKPGDLILWESHFAPLEGATPIESLQSSPLLKEEIKTEVVKKNGELYSLYLFQCVRSN